MKIQILATDLPRSDGKGYQIVLYWRIKELQAYGHEVWLHIINYRSHSPFYDDEIIRLIDNGLKIEHSRVSLVSIILNIALIPFKLTPLQNTLFHSLSIKKLIRRLNRSRSIDITIIYLTRLFWAAGSVKGKVVLEAVDSMALNFRTRYLKESNVFKKCLFFIESYLCLKYEKNIDGCDLVVTVAELDREYFSNVKSINIPLGVNMTSSGDIALDGYPRIIFSGNMKYQPNRDAINWFLETTWHLIMEKFPRAKLYIVGRGLSVKEKNTEPFKGVMFVGEVSSIYDYLIAADVAVAPMVSGSGMQFKVLEAMYAGTPVVVSKIGLGSISALVGRDILVANSPQEFVNSIGECLDSDEIGRNGMEFVQREHSWKSSGKKFIEYISSNNF